MSQPDPRWDRLKDLFAAAAAVPPGEREAFLRERGVGDATVQEVLDLLGSSAPPDEQPGDTIGPYKLLECIGEGGYGSVWMAEQRAPIQRLVALKLLKAGMDSTQVLARFEQERQALALMQHPNIAQVYDAGTTKRGRPFFVMELVKGVPITDYATRERLGLRQRLEVFEQVCRAVQHAHQKGVIHRDIKPSNVLVVTADGRPLAKVIDFGIAKATAGRLTERTLFTEHRAMVGTLAYMSPEQAEGLLDVDTRADVYSLGALLYELLTGGTPFDAGELVAAGFGEMLRVLREVEPEKPSVRVSSKAGAGWVAGGALGERDPKRLFGSLRGDLDWVVMKALEKDRARRYGSAEGLAADVGRYLGGEAVEAVPPSIGYRVRKFLRRNRVWVGAAGAVVTVGILAVSLVEATYSKLQSKADASKRLERSSWVNRISGHSSRVHTALALARDLAHRSAEEELDQTPDEDRHWEWRFAATTCRESPRVLTHELVTAHALDRSGLAILCLLSEPGRILQIDPRTGGVERQCKTPIEGLFSVSPSSSGAVVFQQSTSGSSRKHHIKLESCMSHALPDDAELFDDSNRYLVRTDKGVRIHDATNGRLQIELTLDIDRGHFSLQLLPSGRWLLHERRRNRDARGNDPNQAVLVDLHAPETRVPVPGLLWVNTRGPIHYGIGNWLFDETNGQIVRDAWSRKATRIIDYLAGNVAVAELASAPDPEFAAVAVGSGRSLSPPLPLNNVESDFLGVFGASHRCFNGYSELRPLSLETGEWLGPEPGDPEIRSLMTLDGIHWVTMRTKGLEVASARPPQISLAHGVGPVLSLKVSTRQGGFAVLSTTSSGDTVFVPDTGVPHRTVRSTQVSNAMTSGNGLVQLRQLEDGRFVSIRTDSDLPVTLPLTAPRCSAMALDHEGANAAMVAGGELLHVSLEPASRPTQRAMRTTKPEQAVLAVKGITIAVGDHDGSVTLHTENATDHTASRSLGEAPVTHLSWSPNGQMLLAGTADGTCSLLRSEDLAEVARLKGHRDAVRSSAWSADGKRVFTCSVDGTVRCWPSDPPGLAYELPPLLTLTETAIAGRPTALLMDPQGERLACGYDDGSIRVWDSVPWSERAKQVRPLFASSPK